MTFNLWLLYPEVRMYEDFWHRKEFALQMGRVEAKPNKQKP